MCFYEQAGACSVTGSSESRWKKPSQRGVEAFGWAGNKYRYLTNVLKLPESLYSLAGLWACEGARVDCAVPPGVPHSRPVVGSVCTGQVEELFIYFCTNEVFFVLSIPKKKKFQML